MALSPNETKYQSHVKKASLGHHVNQNEQPKCFSVLCLQEVQMSAQDMVGSDQMLSSQELSGACLSSV